MSSIVRLCSRLYWCPSPHIRWHSPFSCMTKSKALNCKHLQLLPEAFFYCWSPLSSQVEQCGNAQELTFSPPTPRSCPEQITNQNGVQQLQLLLPSSGITVRCIYHLLGVFSEDQALFVHSD